MRLSELYANLNYPEDMEEFIFYMPIKDNYDPSQHTKDENMTRLLEKLQIFLEEKRTY